MRFEAEDMPKLKQTVFLWMRRYCRECKIAIQFESVSLDSEGNPKCPVCGNYLYGSQIVHGMYSKRRLK